MTSTVRKSPTVRRRRLSAELRRMREAKGMTALEVTKSIGLATGTLTNWERGNWQRPSVLKIRALLELYGVTDPVRRAELLMLAEQGIERTGWWHAYRNMMSPEYSTYVGLEAGARRLFSFEALVIHGLLQTEAYTRAIVEAGSGAVESGQLEQYIKVRGQRQELLTRTADPLELEVVLDEAALRRGPDRTDGLEIMREQIGHLLEMAKLPQVTIRVAPFRSGFHPGVRGPFTILTFPEPEDLPAVYIDSPGGQLFIEEPEEVEKFEDVYDRLRKRALSPEDSAQMIADLAI